MAAAENNPAGYYVGRPMNHEQKAPVPQAKEAVDEKDNAPVPSVPGYYAGRVKPAASDQGSASAHHNDEEPGFLAKCLVCFSGGRNAR